MAKGIQAVRGMNDILPEQTPRWRWVEATIGQVMAAYGYAEIRLPIVESTELFHRSIGTVTDIVEKEMYTFEDRNGDSLSLRPEGTAGCVRAGLEHGLLFNQQQRLWYTGPMFRHERPQKGRYRQFQQIGVEAFGMEGPDVDAELILMSRRIFQKLGIDDSVHLQINSLGTSACRAHYRTLLVEYFSGHLESLDEDSQRRLHTNPMRILDSKNPAMAELIAKAPLLTNHLDDDSRQHFTRLTRLLDAASVPYTINPRLVRGLDYYGRTVYEWVTERLGSQNAVCAGGRYDGLVEQLGGKPTSAVGFAIGLERLIALIELANQSVPEIAPHVYLVAIGDAAENLAMQLAEQLRTINSAWRVVLNVGGGSIKTQLRRADRLNAWIALLIGEDEINTGQVQLKYLRSERPQLSVTLAQLSEKVAAVIAAETGHNCQSRPV